MSTEIKITKRLILYAIGLLLVAVIINVNMESHIWVLNSSFISNSLLLTLIGGVCTGLTAVIVEKIYKYRLDKRINTFAIFQLSSLLYAELYYWHCNINELNDNREIPIPENIFDNKIPLIRNYINQIASIDYCVFWGKDKLMVEQGAFKSTYFGQINKMLLDLGYFSRGILENRIEKLKGNMENLTDEYQVLQILDKSILQCMEIVDSYIGVIQIKDLQNSWEQQKKYLEGNYLGIYSVGKTKEFVERNS